MNSDSLRTLADYLDGRIGMAEAGKLRLHAATWEAEIDRLQAVITAMAEQESADNAALRERLEAAERMSDQYRSEGNAFRVLNEALRKQRVADHKAKAALQERLRALERAAWSAVVTIEYYEASDDWLDDRAKELRAALSSQPEVKP